jgi:hypothetical protein
VEPQYRVTDVARSPAHGRDLDVLADREIIGIRIRW